ncbi:MAG: hypothetical protein V4719_24110 [Planctomycetota bacterium]
MFQEGFCTLLRRDFLRAGLTPAVMLSWHSFASALEPDHDQRYGDYVDPESRTILRLTGGSWDENPFGDGCWRSSWFYASLLVIFENDRKAYDSIAKKHGVSIDDAFHFIKHFSAHCSTSHGFKLWKHDKPFTRDQLAPLLYLLACIRKFGDSNEAREAAKKIVKDLSEHEEHGRKLSDKHGEIGPNLGFLIHSLCDSYGVVYRYKSHDQFYAAAVPEAARRSALNVKLQADNQLRRIMGRDPKSLHEVDPEKIAREWHRDYLQFCFETSLQVFNATADYEGTGKREFKVGGKTFDFGLDQAVNGYSVFNGLAQLSLLRVLHGNIDKDIKSWRGMLSKPARNKWGPAFELVAGTPINQKEIESYAGRHISRDLDNDIVMAQRPKKYMDGTFPPSVKPDRHTRLTLDYVILKALSCLWG